MPISTTCVPCASGAYGPPSCHEYWNCPMHGLQVQIVQRQPVQIVQHQPQFVQRQPVQFVQHQPVQIVQHQPVQFVNVNGIWRLV